MGKRAEVIGHACHGPHRAGVGDLKLTALSPHQPSPQLPFHLTQELHVFHETPIYFLYPGF